jgi:hypothetical protein
MDLAYVEASRDIGKARRSRHAIKNRSLGFQGALKSARWEGGRSREFVFISDSEEEGPVGLGGGSDVQELSSWPEGFESDQEEGEGKDNDDGDAVVMDVDSEDSEDSEGEGVERYDYNDFGG